MFVICPIIFCLVLSAYSLIFGALELAVSIITHADGSRVSVAIIRVCVCVSVIVSVCPHDQTKTAETKITNSAQE